jgi:hypothetical protein
MNLTKIALCICLLMPMSSFAEYIARIPLIQEHGGHLPDNSITITDNPGSNGGSGNGNGGNNGGEDGEGGQTPEVDNPILSTDSQGNSCAYNKNNYVMLERTLVSYVYQDMYEWKSTTFSVPVQRGNSSNSVLHYNGKTYDLSWPEIETQVTGPAESSVTKIYYKICEKTIEPQ